MSDKYLDLDGLTYYDKKIKAYIDSRCGYAVGSIYTTIDANFDPNTVFGGTWEKIENKFLRGSGTDADGNTLNVGDTGGEETHTLTLDEMPAHSHGYSSHSFSTTTAGSGSNTVVSSIKSSSATTGTTGGSGGSANPFSILPPYLVVIYWKRVN